MAEILHVGVGAHTINFKSSFHPDRNLNNNLQVYKQNANPYGWQDGSMGEGSILDSHTKLTQPYTP